VNVMEYNADKHTLVAIRKRKLLFTVILGFCKDALYVRSNVS
jgi:hypothetical protein